MAGTRDDYELRIQTQQAERALNGIKNALGAVAGAFAIRELVQYGSAIVATTIQFEKYKATLQTFLGSQKAATDAMARLKDLATTLPQDIDDITNAFVILTRTGLKGTNEEMRNVANIAAGSSRSISQFAEAVADALTGEFERLKEFGIKVGREGGQMIARIGEETVAVADNATALTQQLIALGATKFGGAADNLMNTLGGAMSQLTDSTTNAKVAIGEGMRPALIEVIKQLTEFIKTNEDAAKSLGENLGKALLSARDGALFLAENIDVITVAIAALAAGKLVVLLKAITASLVILTTATSALAAPILIAAAAVAALTFTWLSLSDATTTVGETTATYGEIVKAVFSRSTQDGSKFSKVVGEDIVKAWDSLTKKVEEFNEFFYDLFEDIAEVVKVPINKIIGYTIAMFKQWTVGITDIPKMFLTALEVAGSIVGKSLDNIGAQFGELFDFITSFGDDKIEDTFKGFGDVILTELDKIGNASTVDWAEILGTDYIGNAADSVANTITEIGDSLSNKLSKSLEDAVIAYRKKTAATKEDTDAQDDNNDSNDTANDRLKTNIELMNLQGEIANTLAESKKRVSASLEQQELSRYGGIQRELKSIELEEKRIAKAAKERLREQFGDKLTSDQITAQLKEIDASAARTTLARQAAARAIESNTAAVSEQQKAQQAAIERSQQTFSNGWKNAFEEYQDNATNAAKLAEKLFVQSTKGMEDAIVGFVKTGKFEFKDLIADILETLLRSQIQRIIASTFGGILGGGGGGGAGGVMSNFAGMFANGGTIPSGQFGIVGEAGPEFVSGPATVTPMSSNTSGSTNITYNINAVDAASFKQLVARDPGFIHAVASQGARSVPSRR